MILNKWLLTILSARYSPDSLVGAALYMLGDNTAGQLGDYTIMMDEVFTANPSNISWAQLAVGNSHTLAVRSDGYLFGWGGNNFGQLGVADTFNISGPTQIGTQLWNYVSTRGDTSYGIRKDGKLFAWGYSYEGELGSNSIVSDSFTKSWFSIASGDSYSVAIRSDGSLWGWGTNVSGQLGDSTVISRSSPIQIGTSSWSIVRAGGGSQHTLAIRTDKTLWAWGLGSSGQTAVGTGVGSNRSSPVQIGTGQWAAISGGEFYSMGLRIDGSLWTWGLNTSGQLGHGDLVLRTSPVLITSLLSESGIENYASAMGINPYPISWVKLSAGGSTMAAIASDGSLYTWGLNANGQLGLNDIIDKSQPVKVGTSSWTTVSVGLSYTLAQRSDNSLWSWGGNVFGELGLGDQVNRSSPVQVGAAANGYYSVYFNGSSYYNYPANSAYAFGTGDFTIETWVKHDPSFSSTRLITNRQVSAGQAGTWSLNYSPTDVTFVQVIVGEPGISGSYSFSSNTWYHIAVVRISGILSIYVNGSVITSGSLTTNFSDATQPLNLGWAADGTTPNYFRGYLSNTRIIKGVGIYTGNFSVPTSPFTATAQTTLLTNQSSLLADNSSILATPTAVGSVMVSFDVPSSFGSGFTFTVSDITAGHNHSAAIKQNGELYTWGRNSVGQLGLNNGTNASFPTLVSTTESWVMVDAGDSFTVAINASNALYTWGENTTGQVGDGSVVNRSSPVQITSIAYEQEQINYIASLPTQPALLSWSKVSTGTLHGLGIQSNGTLWAWGVNTQGQLGTNNLINYSYPVLISSDNWNNISAGLSHSVAIRNDNIVFTWGGNTSGQLGLGDLAHRSSPTQIGSFPNGYYSYQFKGSPNYLTIAGNPVPATGTFTIEGWVNITSEDTAGGWLYAQRNANDPNRFGLKIIIDITPYTIVFGHPSFNVASGINTGSMQFGTWYHIAFTRDSSNTLRVFTNGVKTAESANFNNALYQAGSAVMGRLQESAIEYMNGYVSNFRITNTVLYTGDFTVPSYPLTAITGTRLLTAQSSTFIDNSSLQASITDNNTGVSINNIIPEMPPTSSITAVRASSIAAGDAYSLIIDTTSRIFAWGLNASGQLGINTVANTSSPTLVSVAQPTSWTSVYAGSAHSLAISSSGSLFTWGINTVGGLGIGDVLPRSAPTQITTFLDPTMAQNYATAIGATIIPESYTQISTADTYALAIKSDGSLWSWGLNISGQLGDNSSITNFTPAKIGTSSWIGISAGQSHAIAIRSDNTVFTWGFNSAGQLGLGDNENRSSPTQIGTVNSGNNSVYFPGVITVYLSLANNSAFALETSTTWTLECWVRFTSASMGVRASIAGNRPNSATATGWGFYKSATNGIVFYNTGLVASLTSPDNVIVAGVWYHLAVTRSGTSYILYINGEQSTTATFTSGTTSASTTWIGFEGSTGVTGLRGYISNFRICNGTIVYSGNFTPSTTPLTTTSQGASNCVLLTCQNSTIVDNSSNAFTITSNGIVAGGNNIISTSIVSPFLTSPSVAVSATQVRAGSTNSYYINSLGSLFSVGSNASGTIGDATIFTKYNPVQIGTSSWTALGTASSSSTASAIRIDGGLFTWGIGTSGGHGLGDVLNRSSPVQVGTSSWTTVSTNVTSSAIRSDRSLFAWGANQSGQLGDNTIITRSSPVQIGTSSWTIVLTTTGATVGVTAAIRSDGGLFAWGPSTTGLTARSSPVQVGTSSWAAVGAAVSTILAIRSGNSLFSWGLATNGLLGNSSTGPNTTSPIQVLSDFRDSFVSIGAGSAHSAFVRSDGQLFTVGLNAAGQLGDNTVLPKSRSVQIGTASISWVQVSVGGSNTSAINANGSLFMFGFGTSGQLAQGDIISRSSPVQVGTSSWTTSSANTNNIMAIRNDGTLFGWGLNTSGQLGNYRLTNPSSPSIIKSVNDSWSTISAGLNTAAAIRSDKLLFTFGLNTSGQLGIDNITNRSEPTQVGSGRPSGYFSNLFNGTSQYLELANSTPLIMSTGNYTIEAWVYPLEVTGIIRSIYSKNGTSVTNGSILFGITATGALLLDYNNSTFLTGGTLTVSTWTHVAVSRVGGTVYLFINGVQSNSASDTTDIFGTSVARVGLGRGSGSVSYWSGYISNLRVVKGVGVYTGNFTVPTTPLAITQSAGTNISAITGTQTSLLTSRTSTITDSSSWNAIITNVSSVTSTFTNPFGEPPSSAQSTWVDVNITQTTTLALKEDYSLYAWGQGTSGQVGNNATASVSSPALIGTKSWTSIAAGAAISGAIDNTGKLYTWGTGPIGELGRISLNAVSSPSIVPSIIESWNTISAGASHGIGIRADNLLFTWGSNSNGQLGLVDITNRSIPTIVGSAANPNGYYSVFFDGVTSYQVTNTTPIGAGDFTVEFWVNPSSQTNSSFPGMFDCRSSGSDSSGFGIYFRTSSSSLALRIGATDNTVSWNIVPIGGWTHIALTRLGTSMTLYVNGTSVITATSSANFSRSIWYIGKTFDNFRLNGYLTNLRVVIGSAVYTSNFSVPTSPLTSIANTALLTFQSSTVRDNSPNAYAITTS